VPFAWVHSDSCRLRSSAIEFIECPTDLDLANQPTNQPTVLRVDRRGNRYNSKTSTNVEQTKSWACVAVAFAICIKDLQLNGAGIANRDTSAVWTSIAHLTKTAEDGLPLSIQFSAEHWQHLHLHALAASWTCRTVRSTYRHPPTYPSTNQPIQRTHRTKSLWLILAAGINRIWALKAAKGQWPKWQGEWVKSHAPLCSERGLN